MRFEHGRMTLVRVSPDRGYRKEIEADRPEHIDVRFTRDGNRSSEIELRVVDGDVVRTPDRYTWDWSGMSSVSPIFKGHAGGHRLGAPVGPGGRLASAPMENADRGKRNGGGPRARASV